MQWLFGNKEWLFSGIGVTVLALIFGALRWFRPAKPSPPTTVVVHVQNPTHNHAEARTASAPLAKTAEAEIESSVPVTLERIVAISPEEIHAAIAAVPPLQRKSVAERYKGLKIEWDTRLRSAYESEGTVRLTLGLGDPLSLIDITCRVRLSDYKELGIMPVNSLIRVYGEIAEADRYSVELREARLLFFEAPKGT